MEHKPNLSFGKYFTDVELGRYLGVRVSLVKTFDIHKSPRGYSEQEVVRWINENSIPVGDWKDIVAVGSGDDKRVVWAECLFSALYKCSPNTKALIVPSSAVSEELWESIKARIPGLFLICWGGRTDVGHAVVPNLKEAIELAWKTN